MDQVNLLEPHAHSFQVLADNEPRLAGQVVHCELAVCQAALELHIVETKEFAIFNWFVGLMSPNKEILTIMFLDPNGQVLCMLRFTDLALLDHELILDKFARTELLSEPLPLKHKIRLKYEVVERVQSPTLTRRLKTE